MLDIRYKSTQIPICLVYVDFVYDFEAKSRLIEYYNLMVVGRTRSEEGIYYGTNYPPLKLFGIDCIRAFSDMGQR